MSGLEESVEKTIQDAIARGEFDHLPGEGKPLSRGDDGPGWWVRRYVERTRQDERSLEAAREIELRLAEAWVLPDKEGVRNWVASINQQHSADLDPEEIVTIWRRMERARR